MIAFQLLERGNMNEIIVKVTFASGRASNLTRTLFGYPKWIVKSRSKQYEHKSVVGKLEGIIVKRAGRGKFLVSETNLSKARQIVEREGGIIRKMEPQLVSGEEAEKLAFDEFVRFAGIIITILHYAASTQYKEMYVESLQKAKGITIDFQKYI